MSTSDQKRHHSKEFERVCREDAIIEGFNKCLMVQGRAVVLWKLKRPRTQPRNPVFAVHNNYAYYALDAMCYHMGGPLEQSDIEELGGRATIDCPWHHYKIHLDTGEGIYQDLQRKWKSKGVRQRAHHVKVSGGYVWIKTSPNEAEGGERVSSDDYEKMFPGWASKRDIKPAPAGKEEEDKEAGSPQRKSTGSAPPDLAQLYLGEEAIAEGHTQSPTTSPTQAKSHHIMSAVAAGSFPWQKNLSADLLKEDGGTSPTHK
eukprot:g51315.t1